MTTMQITILIFGLILSGIAVFLYCLKNAALDPEEPHTVDLEIKTSENWFLWTMVIIGFMVFIAGFYLITSFLIGFT